ncbi:hypothetical protein [Neolewinella antarctica]|uniref:Outer membrane protein beta-barrel domain-containing protein n=1 Tax=Neolewinella antarctica TaxID=442734 RepID=A0ABX0XBW0_9BACT|nr:hypothetical protein [Neolewinella antarctica]NJC26739.1 hypothetical protein [Neolewinella antarctica]
MSSTSSSRSCPAQAHWRGSLIWLLLILPLGWLSAQQTSVPKLPSDTYQLQLFKAQGRDTTLPDADAALLNFTKRRYDRLLRRQRRKDYEGFWAINGSVNVGSRSVHDYTGSTFRRSSAADQLRTFIMPSGEIIPANGNDNFYGDITGYSSYLLRVGIARQTRWGGYFHLTPGLYRRRVALTGDPYGHLEEDEIQVVRTSKVMAGIFELGFQYTFFRRRRFRPYLGFGSVNLIRYSGETRRDFYEARTRQTGVIGGFRIKDSFPLYPDLCLTAGFQFELTRHLSVGAHAYASDGVNLYINAPIGFEVRYLFK